MLNPLEAGNSIRSLVEQHKEPETLRGIIKKVNRVTRHIHVLVNGYGLLRGIPVNRGINLGTPDRKIVFPGDTAVLVKSKRGWECVAVEHKDRCGSKTSEFTADVVVENQVEPLSADSYTVQQIGALNLPSDLRLPPFQLLGNLTLPTQRFTGGTTMLCGLPPCVDCSPNGLSTGMSPVLSSDDTFPNGCWVWDFKERGCLCEGSPVTQVNYQISAYTPVDASSIRTVTDGAYTYAVWLSGFTATLITYRLVIFDVTDPTTPTEVGTTTVSVTNLGISPSFVASLGGITKIFDTVWIDLAQRSYQTVPFGPSIDSTHLISFDVTDPTTPTVIADTIDGSSGDDIGLFVPRAFSLGGNLYLVSQSANSGSGTTMDLVTYDINDPSAPSRIGQITISTADAWYTHNNSWQYINGFVYMLLRDSSPTQIDTYDITTPSSPSFIGRFDVGVDNDGDGTAFLDVMSNDMVYVATNDDSTSNYINKINYSNPASPSIVDTFDAGVAATDDFRFIRICGTTYFFTAQRGTGSGADTFIRAWPDMSSLPTALTVADFQGMDMQVNETHIYLSGFASPTDGYSHLFIADCVACGTPLFTSNLQYDSVAVTFSRSPVMDVVGNYAYLYARRNDATGDAYLHIIDISNPNSMVEVGSINLPTDTGGTEGRGHGVQVYGNYAYVVLDYRDTGAPIPQMYVVDISNPASPSLVHTEDFVAEIGNTEMQLYVEVFNIGASVYVIMSVPSGTTEFQIVDVTTPTAPTVVGIVTAGIGQLAGPYCYSDGLLYVTFGNPVSSMGKVNIYDLSDPTTPTLVSTATLGSTVAFNPTDIRVSGNYLYNLIASDRLIIADVTDPTSVTVISDTAVGTDAYQLAICGNSIIVSLFDGTVQGWDITNPTAPTFISDDIIPDWTPSSFSLTRNIEVANKNLFACGMNTSDLLPAIASLSL